MGALNLRFASTTAKLEAWVSDPRNSQKLIDDLKKKLNQSEMEALEEYVRGKKLKKNLSLYSDDIDKIRNNEELGWFLDVINDATFPLSLLDLFFQKDTDPENHSDYTDVRPDFRNYPSLSKNNDFAILGRENMATDQQRNGGASVVGRPSTRNNASSARKKNDMLLNWAKKQAKVAVKELKQVFENISIKNVVEHSEYPFFVAENIMVYKKPETGEQEILIVTDENSARMTTLIHYQMFVCNIYKSIVLSSVEPKEQHIKYNETLVPTNLCLRCIAEVFLPALVVFKQIQRKEKFSH